MHITLATSCRFLGCIKLKWVSADMEKGEP